MAIGAGDQHTILIDKLELYFVLIFKGLGIGDAGTVKFIISLTNIVCKKICCGAGTVIEIGLHIGVVAGGEGCRHCQNADQTQNEDHAHCIQQPSLF